MTRDDFICQSRRLIGQSLPTPRFEPGNHRKPAKPLSLFSEQPLVRSKTGEKDKRTVVRAHFVIFASIAKDASPERRRRRPLPRGGGRVLGRWGRDRFGDSHKHTIEILKDVIAPEAQDPYASLREFLSSRLVDGGLLLHRMLLAIQLDSEPRLIAVEVENVAANGMLAPELQAAESTRAQ